MNTLALNEKELLLMETIKKENSKTLDEKMADKLAEKEYQRENQKLIEKDRLKIVETDVKDSMDQVFKQCVYDSSDLSKVDLTLNRFYNADYREQYINTLGKTTVEKDYIDKIYDKVLKQVYNKWKNHVKYNELNQNIKQQQILQKELEQEEKDAKFERNVITFFTVLKWICIIVFAPIVLIFMLCLSLAKGK